MNYIEHWAKWLWEHHEARLSKMRDRDIAAFVTEQLALLQPSAREDAAVAQHVRKRIRDNARPAQRPALRIGDLYD